MWEINVGNQFATLAFSMCLGCILCAVYDVLRASRKAGFNSFFTVFVTDILFWILSAFTTFIFLIARTNGEIRGYVLISELVGFAVFRFTVSRFIFLIFTFIFKAIQKLNSCFNKGFEFLYTKTDSIILKICNFTSKNFKRAVKSIKKLLKSRRKMLYTNENNTKAEYVLNETKT